MITFFHNPYSLEKVLLGLNEKIMIIVTGPIELFHGCMDCEKNVITMLSSIIAHNFTEANFQISLL